MIPCMNPCMNPAPTARTRPPGSAPGARRARGITLIELMVGMVIGLLATLVITQVATVFEGRKRSTTSGSDAQVNGALALQTLQRDILTAGYGFTSGGVAGCTQIRGQVGGTAYTWTMAPVLITQGSGGSATVSGGPDTVQVLMSSNSNFSLPMRVATAHRRDGNTFVLDTRTNVGNAVGDLVMAVPPSSGPTSASPTNPTTQVTPNWCSLFNITAISGANLTHDTGSTGPWNQDSTSTVFPGSLGADISYAASTTPNVVASNSYLVNLGTMTDRTYRIPQSGDGDYATYPPNSLLMRSFVTSAPASPTVVPLFSQVVTLQAVYGLDTNADKAVDTWTTTSPTTSAGWDQLVAVRIALVARSNQYEKDVVTATEPTWLWNGSDAQTLSIAGYVPCDSGDSGCWQHYRYRVYETVVPLRNMIWRS